MAYLNTKSDARDNSRMSEAVDYYQKHPDRDIREALFNANIPLLQAKLIKSVAFQEYDDIYQEAGICLMKAIDRYDYSSNLAFSTFASSYILGGAKNAYNKYSSNIGVHYTVIREARAAEKFIAEYADKHNGELPTDAQVAKRLHMSKDRYAYGIKSFVGNRYGMSIQAPIDNEDSESADFESLLSDPDSLTPYLQLENEELKMKIQLIIKEILSTSIRKHKHYNSEEEYEQEIHSCYHLISARFGLDGNPGRTLQECADEIGICKQGIQQKLSRLIQVFRTPCNRVKFRQFLNIPEDIQDDSLSEYLFSDECERI